MMRRNYYADYDGTRGYQPQPPYGYRPSNLLGHTGGNPYVGPNNIPLNDYELARRATNLRYIPPLEVKHY